MNGYWGRQICPFLGASPRFIFQTS